MATPLPVPRPDVAAPPEASYRVQCVYCHHDAPSATDPDACPTCGDVRIYVTTPWQALRERLRADFELGEWRKLRDRLR